MENASKALIMAGGVLISLLVIGLLVMFFNNLSDLQNIKQSGEETQLAVEFNKQYDVYARNVYGSELLSIASKVEDYNKRESENKGYSKVELKVTFNSTPDSDFFKTNVEYNSKELLKIVEDIKKAVKIYSSRDETDKCIYKGADNISTRTVAQLATMRTKDLKAFFGLEDDDIIDKEITDKIQEYNNIKNLLSRVKQSVFVYDDFIYDDNTGRIKTMIYHYE